MKKVSFLNKEFTNLTLFSLGKLVSVFGSLIYSFAMSLYILRETGNGLSFATNMVIAIVPIIIVSPFAGVLADRFSKKILVISMDILSGILLIGLFAYISSTELQILTIYITTFILTVLGVIFNISLESAKPNIVSDNKLMNINSISKIIDSTSSILAPVLGGMIYAMVESGWIDIKIFIIINGVSFIISALSELFIDFSFNQLVQNDEKSDLDDAKEIESQSTGKSDVFGDILEGIKYLKNHKQLMSLVAFFIVINFFIGLALLVPLPFIINEVLVLDSTYFGIIQGAFPAGMIIGSLVVKKVSERISYELLLPIMIVIGSIVMMLIGLPLLVRSLFITNLYYLIYYSIIMITFGVVIAFVDIPILYLLQRLVAEQYRGRVMSLVMSIVKIVSPIALLLSGLLINNVSPWMLPIIGGGLQLFYSLYHLLKQIKSQKNTKDVVSAEVELTPEPLV